MKNNPNNMTQYMKYYISILFLIQISTIFAQVDINTALPIVPDSYLLWYHGKLGENRIHLKLKITHSETVYEEKSYTFTYTFDKYQKGYNGSERISNKEGDDIEIEMDGIWQLPFEFNTMLVGEWVDEEVLPMVLRPLYVDANKYTFEATIIHAAAKDDSATSESISAINIRFNEDHFQTILFESPISRSYFNFVNVDINYDGYLDLAFNDLIYLYDPTSKKFTNAGFEDTYIPYLDILEMYNLNEKSFIAQMNRTMIEYRAKDGEFLPCQRNSYFPNDDGNMTFITEHYIDGRWIETAERIEYFDADGVMIEDEPDKVFPKNYQLEFDLNSYDKSIYFTPHLYNYTDHRQAYNSTAKLYTETITADGIKSRQFINEVALDNEPELVIDDAPISFDGNEYTIQSWNGPVPLLPTNLTSNNFVIRLVLAHELFGEVYSNSLLLDLPLALEIDSNTMHFSGDINSMVNGDLYLIFHKNNDMELSGTFINTQTDQRIKLEGSYSKKENGDYGIHLLEYENGEEISGYFEGEIVNGNFSGNRVNAKRTVQVPYSFQRLNK